MTRGQALTIGILFGLVLLVFAGLAVVALLAPVDLFATPAVAPTATSLLPTSTPTFPSFLPTPSLETAQPPAPTPTNTRLPTLTPRPPASPTPTVLVQFTLPTRRPTPTPELPPTIALPAPAGSTPEVEATATIQVQYSITFNAEKDRIDRGDCTYLSWRVEGGSAVRLDNDPVRSADRDEVCPSRDTTYQLYVLLPDGNSATREVTITVRDSNDNDNDTFDERDTFDDDDE